MELSSVPAGLGAEVAVGVTTGVVIGCGEGDGFGVGRATGVCFGAAGLFPEEPPLYYNTNVSSPSSLSKASIRTTFPCHVFEPRTGLSFSNESPTSVYIVPRHSSGISSNYGQ